MQLRLPGSRLQARGQGAVTWPRLTRPWLFGRIRFFDPYGQRLRDDDTPDELEMEDDDVIDAFLFQVNIGIFGEHRGGCGVELLQEPEPEERLPRQP